MKIMRQVHVWLQASSSQYTVYNYQLQVHRLKYNGQISNAKIIQVI